MKLIIGIGNPGQKYKNTRHNVGFMLLEKLLNDLNNVSREIKTEFILHKGSFKSEKIILLKPMTYVNLSGNAVRRVVDYYKINIADIIVVFDDVALPLGRLRYRPKGSAGGHNGIKSMISSLKTNEFSRLRIGIGNQELMQHISLSDFVLGKFRKEEKIVLDEILDISKESIWFFVENDIEKTMGKYNKKAPISS